MIKKLINAHLNLDPILNQWERDKIPFNIATNLAGDHNKDARQAAMYELTGIKHPKAQSGIHALEDAIREYIETQEQEKHEEPVEIPEPYTETWEEDGAAPAPFIEDIEYEMLSDTDTTPFDIVPFKEPEKDYIIRVDPLNFAAIKEAILWAEIRAKKLGTGISVKYSQLYDIVQSQSFRI